MAMISGRRDTHVLLILLWTRRRSVSAVVGERLGRPYRRREAGAGAHAPAPTQAALFSSESGRKDLPSWRIWTPAVICENPDHAVQAEQQREGDRADAGA